MSTHVAGLLDFESGAIATIVTSFDVWGSDLPHIEVYGTEGALSVPDPNVFEGAVRVRGAGEDGWTDVPLAYRAGRQRDGPGRDGVGDTGRPPAARRRTALQPRPRRHARGARGVGRRKARRHDNHVRAPRHHARRTAGGRLRPMSDEHLDSGGRELVPRLNGEPNQMPRDDASGRGRGASRHARSVGRPAPRLRTQRHPGRMLVHGLASFVDGAEADPGGGSPRASRGAGRRRHADGPAGVRRRRRPSVGAASGPGRPSVGWYASARCRRP